MPPLPKPKFDYAFNVKDEIRALNKYMKGKPSIEIPSSTNENLLIATWNISNFGQQQREKEHLQIIAEIISWFDIMAVQETKENLADLSAVCDLLGKDFKMIFTDEGGNNERMAFIYKSTKVNVLGEIAELAIPPSEYKNIKLPGIKGKFNGFDRSPFMVSFLVRKFSFSLLNVHLYFGDDTEDKSINRRCLEAFCIARWASLRSRSKFAYTNDIISLGDFNLPKNDINDRVYQSLLAKGLELPQHSTKIYSNINNDKAYDQIAFLPGLKNRIQSSGVFPYDNIIFESLYKNFTKQQFASYLRYYISDHRPMWMALIP